MSNGEWHIVSDENANQLNAGALAMHAALLPTGKILYFGGSERSEAQHNAGPRGWSHAAVWTPESGQVDTIPSPGWDLFCCGHCNLGSGQLLVVGGTEGYADEGGPIHAPHGHLPGLRNSAIFDPTLIDQLWQNEQVAGAPQPGAEWTGWYAHGLAGDRAKQLITVQHDDGRLHAFMIGIDNRLRHNEQIAFQSDPQHPTPRVPVNAGQTWTGWNALVTVENRGKHLTIAKHVDGRLHAFMIGVDDQVWHNAQTSPSPSPGSSWNVQWFPFSAVGNRAKYMTVAQHTDGRLHAFMIGMDNQVWRNEQIPSGWTTWQKLSAVGDNTAKHLTVVRNADGSLHAFKIGVNDLDQVSHIAQNSPISPGSSWNAQWSPFSASGNRAKYMTVVQHADGRLHAFMIGMDNQVWRNEQIPSGWTTWQKLSTVGDNTAKYLTVVRNADGSLHAFKIGVDDLDQVSHIAQNFPISPGSSWNSQWSPFSALGNRAKYMTVAQHADGRLHAFMIGMDNQMWHNEQNTSGWGGWNILSSSGDRAKSLVATRDDDNRLHAFAIGIGRSPWIDVSLMLPERNSSNGGGRWYPTPVTLPDGRVAVMGGHPGSLDSRHSNYMVEVFDPLLNQWTDAGDEPGAVINKVSTDPEIYPRLHVLPDGNVFCVLLADDVSYKWNPQAKQFSAQTTPAMAVTEMRFQNNSSKNRWTSVLLPLRPQDGYHPRVLAAGGMQLAYVLDVNAPQNGWQATQPRVGSAPLRKYASLVLTPDGKVLMIGGTRGGPPPQNLDDNDATQAVREVEQFDPVTGTWTTLAAAAVPRQYHSTALLLPDGRVWTGGSNPNDSGSREERMEVFSPPYLFKGDRPIIASAPDVIKWNTNFEIHSPDAASITRVVVIRCGSATHGFDSDQRFIQLSIQGPVSNIGILVKAPPHGMIAPPGYYMLFVLTANDVPSHAVIVRCAG